MIIAYGNADLEVLHKAIQKLTFKDSEAKKSIPPEITYTKQGLQVTFVDRDEYTIYDFHADYASGKLGRKAVAVIAFGPAKYDAGAEDEPAVNHAWRKAYDGKLGAYTNQKTTARPSS